MEVSNRLTMLKGSVTARCDARSDRNCAWVCVYPRSDGQFDVSTVEIDQRYLEADDDVGEDDIIRSDLGIFGSIAQVNEAVKLVGVDPDDLAAPWRNDYPL
ncbi:hypothetical protein [Nocardia cyriacigeorgica]|uniref:hypothetical protein n=1 Tax=Nocardia cyriacigeorgica TaxID=135487 RepID=UPI002490C3C1|nr:hypothetical protein [Nocardia cyriacigeorgica]